MEGFMNKCEQTQIRILEEVSLSAEEMKHLEVCPDCRNLAEFVKRMEHVPLPELDPPGHIDSAILEHAGQAVKQVRWKPVIWKVALPAAAAFAMAAGALFYQPGEKAVPKIRDLAEIKTVSVPDPSFDEQVFALAVDVASGMDTFSETMDLLI